MHYIRFLKVPRLVPVTGTLLVLSAKITITTDLGDAFLAEDIALEVECEDEEGRSRARHRKVYAWRGLSGMRSLDVSVSLTMTATKTEKIRMLVRLSENRHAVDKLETILTDGGGEGAVVPVRSSFVALNGQEMAKRRAERLFTTPQCNAIKVWEETGESIARHIWDAGLVFAAYLSCLPSPHIQTPALPLLRSILQRPNLNIIELGAGCGIVSLALCSSFPPPSVSHLLLTDLPEAQDILSHNLRNLRSPDESVSHTLLDWSAPLPNEVEARQWDLVLVADCTYNPDVVPDLVKTLTRLAKRKKGRGRETLVAVALKWRHDSEAVFFELMRKAEWEIREEVKIPLPVLGGERQEIEIWVFGRGEGVG